MEYLNKIVIFAPRLLISLDVFVGNGTQFVIPFLTETAHQRTFEEAVYAQSQLAALLHCVLAHIPAVVVERHGAVLEPLLADRVEGARYGLDEL